MQRLMTNADFLSQPQMSMVDRIVTVVLSEKEQAVIDDIKISKKLV